MGENRLWIKVNYGEKRLLVNLPVKEKNGEVTEYPSLSFLSRNETVVIRDV